MQVGVLKKRTYFKAVNNVRIVLPKGTVVKIDKTAREIVFNEHVKGFRVGGRYYLDAYGSILMLEPFEPKPPFPFSRI